MCKPPTHTHHLPPPLLWSLPQAFQAAKAASQATNHVLLPIGHELHNEVLFAEHKDVVLGHFSDHKEGVRSLHPSLPPFLGPKPRDTYMRR